jgi:polysaccharide export outer membrane protein
MKSIFFNRSNAFIIVMMSLFISIVYPQERRATEQNSRTDLFDLSQEEKEAATVNLSAAEIPLESTVEPDRYIVGPSDILSVNVWMSPPLNFNLPVTPEGTLIVPTVGEIDVANLSLAKAKEKIISEARKKYLHVDITATLVKPRPVIVTVMGNVLNAGVYTLNAVDRASRAIDLANIVKRTQSDGDLNPVKRGMSVRAIAVHHRDGTQDRVDIPKYYATHDGKWNPYLREGDIVVVPRKSEKKFAFAVYGQVNIPGTIELVEGDRLLDGLQMAEGMTSTALPEQVIFSRLGDDGRTIANTTVNINDVIAGRADNTLLQPGDRIIVQGKSDLREDFNVDVKGEVVYSGTYPITNDRTHLSEIIRQSGGFTDHAALGMAYVLRQSVPTADRASDWMLTMRGEASNDDSIGFSMAAQLRTQHEEVTVDFEKLFIQHDTSQDIILKGEDQIFIPSKDKTVYVFGQVALPGHIPIVEGRDVSYYIKKAGGLTDHANGGSVKIIKGKTRQWLSPNDAKLEDGDYIWVPSEPNHPFAYYMNIASQAATVISVMIGIGVLIVQVTKK